MIVILYKLTNNEQVVDIKTWVLDNKDIKNEMVIGFECFREWAKDYTIEEKLIEYIDVFEQYL